jgi:hypothetical protein
VPRLFKGRFGGQALNRSTASYVNKESWSISVPAAEITGITFRPAVLGQKFSGFHNSGRFERLSGFFACPGNSHPHWTSLRARLYTSPWWADDKIDIKKLTRTAQQKTKILLSKTIEIISLRDGLASGRFFDS